MHPLFRKHLSSAAAKKFTLDDMDFSWMTPATYKEAMVIFDNDKLTDDEIAQQLVAKYGKKMIYHEPMGDGPA